MKHKTLALALVALLLVGTATASAPIPRSDFGDATFGFEPDPPETRAPSVDVDTDSLGAILRIATTNFSAGDKLSVPLRGAPLVLEGLDAGGIQATLFGPNSVKKLTLPDAPDEDFVMRLTPATLSLDRAGDNPGLGGRAADYDASQVKDATLFVSGEVASVTDVLATDNLTTNPGELEREGTFEVTAELLRLDLPEAPSLDVLLVDPDSRVVLDTVENHIAGVAVSDVNHSTATDIKNAVTGLGELDVSLNGALDKLASSTKHLGAVDIDNLAAVMAASNLRFRQVETTLGDEPATLFDADTKTLACIDGCFGKVAILSGMENVQVDNDRITGLKDPYNALDTSFIAVMSDAKARILVFDDDVANFETLVHDNADLLRYSSAKQVFTTDLDRCKAAQVEAATPNVVCMSPSGKKLAGHARQAIAPLKDPGQLLPGGITGPQLVDMKRIGHTVGLLKAFDPTHLVPEPGKYLGLLQLTIPDKPRFALGEWSIPQSGLGSLEGLGTVNPSTPELDAPDLDFEPTLLDGIYEMASLPSLPQVFDIVPLDAGADAVSLITDAAGNGVSFVPVDVLQELPVGATAEVKQRWVGGFGSDWTNRALAGVSTTTVAEDPLGLSSTSYSEQSNSNGYVVLAMPAFSVFSVTAFKTGHQDAHYEGTAPGPGQSEGYEYQMHGNDDGVVEKVPGGWTGIGLGVVAIVAIVTLGLLNRDGGGRK